MTQPKRAVQTQRGRFYVHPKTGQELISVTNTLNALGKPGLVPWAAGIVADGAISQLPLLLPRLRADRRSVRYELTQLVQTSRDNAANLGTEIHTFAEQHVKTGLPVKDMPQRVQPYVAAFLDFLQAIGAGLEDPLDAVEASEMTVANPHAGYAGTLDLCLALPLYPRQGTSAPAKTDDGTRHSWVVDIKTSERRGRTSVYGENALQVCALAHATEMWVEDPEAPDGVLILPNRPRPIGGATLNLRPSKDPKNGWTLLPQPVDDAAYAAFLAALKVTSWSHEWKDTYGGDRDKGVLSNKDAKSAHRALGRQLRIGKDDKETAHDDADGLTTESKSDQDPNTGGTAP